MRSISASGSAGKQSPPGYMLVRPRENQCAAIENGGIGPFDVEYFQGRSPAASSTPKGCHIDRGIERSSVNSGRAAATR
jgi:hypothetical protein